MLAVVVQYRLELETGFGIVAWIIAVGFPVHALLPRRLRLPFFLALTVFATYVLLGADGTWLLGIGLVLVGLCHLPAPWAVRVVLVLLAGALLAALRLSWIQTGWAATVLPVLAAMFMFRLVLYLYDLKDERTPASLPQRLAYFFLLPNVCFPLFPVVDYRTFVASYFDDAPMKIYRKGVKWMVRGASHLLAYRLLYYLMPRADTELTGVVSVVAFMGMTYGLYLRVSGLFHLIVGSLCLFGFDLPRTNNHYFLASSFSDLWRRINIYWKDFMMNVVFYPVFLQARSLAMSARLALATGAVFFVTWLLHSYQWFWLEGRFPVTATDIVFWGVLGAALVANSLWEARTPRAKSGGDLPGWRESLARSLQVAGVFLAMSALWTLWYSDSLATWWYRTIRIRESGPEDGLLVLVLTLSLLGALTMGQWLQPRMAASASWRRLRDSRAARMVPAAAAGALLVLLPLGRTVPESLAARLVEKLQSTHPNRIDRERQERGYYEVLTRSNRLVPTAAVGEGGEAPFLESAAVRATGDIRGFEIVPGRRSTVWGAPFSSNRWSMRDRDYARAKPEGVWRIALLGSSHTMGLGVGDGETYESLVEERLNQQLSPRTAWRYEILNLAVAGYSLPQVLYVSERISPGFSPDVVLFVVNPHEAGRVSDRLSAHILKFEGEIGEEFDYVADILDRAEARPGLPSWEFERRLRPYGWDLIGASMDRMAQAIRDQGALPVLVLLPLTEGDFSGGERSRWIEIANRAGFAVLSLSGVYQGHELDEIRYDRTDNHPNALGHRLVAARLYSAMAENAGQLLGDLPGDPEQP